MRVMVIIKASKESEAGVLPSEKELTEMGEFNDELTGVLEKVCKELSDKYGK